MTDSISTDDRILIAIAAQSDALWFPERNRGHGAQGAIYERRRDFVASGISWNSGLAGDVDSATFRQKAARSLDVLKGEGLIDIPPSGGVKTKIVKLTDAGDDRVRDLVGLTSFGWALHWLDQLARFEADGKCYWSDGHWYHSPSPDQQHFEAGWCSEIEIAGFENPPGKQWTANEWNEVKRYLGSQESLFAALASRGYVVTNTHAQENVFYALTPLGVSLAKERLRAGCPDAGREPIDTAEPFDLFKLIINGALNELATATPTKNEIGIPRLAIMNARGVRGRMVPQARAVKD